VSSNACRAFEERLAALLDLDSGRRPIPVDPHAADCPACAQLLEEVLFHSALFARLKKPDAPELISRLREAPPDFEARRAAAPILDLLTPGALRVPEPSSELTSRLVFLPTRARTRSASAPAPKGALGKLASFFSDWRVSVVAAYAVSLVFATVLRVDPLSMARQAATGLGAAGERAIAEAKAEAGKRLEASKLAQAAAPLTTRLEYRVYRTVTSVRARAAAYGQLVFDKVVGRAFETENAEARTSRSAREPRENALRS
jgi:hypothetical protein